MKKKIVKKDNNLIIGIISIVVIIIIVLIILGIKRHKEYYGNVEVANLINSNSNLPFEYMTIFNKKNKSLSGYERLNNYTSFDFKNNDISFRYYGYPNDESKYYLGEVVLLTNKYNILGVSIGDEMEDAISKIKKYGFELEESSNNYLATLNYKEFTIRLVANSKSEPDQNNNKIRTLQLNAGIDYVEKKTK